MPKRLTREEFIEKATKVHDGKYDYSKIVYVNTDTKIQIGCPIHGDFWQDPRNHLKGKGCQKCAKNYRNTQHDFIEKAKQIHGDFYDYSKVVFTVNREKVKIICPIHGEFEQEANSHLQGSGCPVCANEKRTDFLHQILDGRDEKIKATCLERYGVVNPMQADDVKAKQQQTIMDRYGVKNVMCVSEFIEKCCKTKMQHGTFNTSEPEEMLYDMLVNVFGKKNVIRQYCSKLYPFQCDFYVVSRNLYIELNAHWSHGFHWFGGADNDMSLLQDWIAKSQDSMYYQNAVDVWSIRDVKKREIARKHALNYVVFWDNTLRDAELWFSMDCPDGQDWKTEYSWLKNA